VGHAARGEGELAGAAGETFPAELEGELALEHVEGLVEVVVMEPRATAPGQLDDRDSPSLCSLRSSTQRI
jgi:hypothetical protein